MVCVMKLKRHGYHHGDLKRALVDAALRHIATDGVESLTLRELARATGVSHGAPYRHFPDKQALVDALADDGYEKLLAAMTEKAGAETDPVRRFELAGIAYVTFAIESPVQLGLMFGPESGGCEPHEPLTGAAKKTFEYVVDIISAGQRAGVFRPGEPLLMAVSAWALVHGVAVLFTNGHLRGAGLEGMGRDALVVAVSRALCEGLLVSRSSEGQNLVPGGGRAFPEATQCVISE